MSSTLHFPNEETMVRFLCNHNLLKMPFYQEKGITEAVAQIAAERFADSDKVEMGIKLGTQLIIYDLQNGEDGFTGKKLTKIDLPEVFWRQLSMGLEKALLDCAKENSKI